MRKGRSQRKTRGSLPPLSNRLAAAGAGIGAPQVVIGLTDPPDSMPDALIEESRETLSSETRVSETRESRPTRRPSLSPESQRALSMTPPPVSVAPVSVPEPDPFSEPELPEASDEVSIPPVGDLSVEPVAERFFSEGELARHDEPHDHWEGLDASTSKAERKAEPHVVERRARFSRYVTWAVGGAAIVCLAALIRTTTSHPASAAPKAAAVAVAAPEVVAPPVAKAAQAPAAPGLPSAPNVDVPSEAPPAVVAAPVTDAPNAKSALEEKNDCRKSLERGKLADAIAAGERAVALDTEDGEAWLLLGASYQEKGNATDARRAYTSCVKDGKRGPVGECRQMLR